MLGYKVLYREGGRLRSKADRRQGSPAVVGAELGMHGRGVFLSPSRQYVLDYYSDGPDAEYEPGVEEVIVTLEFDPREILFGNLTDREAEATVRSARIVAIEPTYRRSRHANPASDRLLRQLGVVSGEEATVRAALVLGLEPPTRLYGCGDMGCVAPIGGNRVLKVTRDPFEVKLATIAVRDGVFDGFARVFVAPMEVWRAEAGPVWAYVREDVTPYAFEGGTPEALYRLKDAADYRDVEAYEERLPKAAMVVPGIAALGRRLIAHGYLLGDMHQRNIGQRSDGSLVLFDGRAYDIPAPEENYGLPARLRRRNPTGTEAWLDGLSDRLDYWRVQEADDLGRLGERGYHYARRQALARIETEGLGRHPEVIEDHEIEYWIASRLGHAPAAKAARALLQGDRVDGARIVEAALRKIRDLKVLWFSSDPAYKGQTARGTERVSFDLAAVGQWVSKHDAFVFTDNAGGWGLSWVGPPIPSALFRVEAGGRASNPLTWQGVPATMRQRQLPFRFDLIELVTDAEKKLDVATEDRVWGCGAMGCALPIEGGGETLKLTTDKAEVAMARLVFDMLAEDRVGYARILKPPVGLEAERVAAARSGTWAYVREAVAPLPRPSWEQQRPVPPIFWVLDKLDEAALENDRGFYEDNLTALEDETAYPEMRSITRTLRAGLRLGFLIGDVAHQNIGTTDDGRVVLYDAEAFPIVGAFGRAQNPIDEDGDEVFYIVARRGVSPLTSQAAGGSPARYEGCGHRHRTAAGARASHRRELEAGRLVVWEMRWTGKRLEAQEVAPVGAAR